MSIEMNSNRKSVLKKGKTIKCINCGEDINDSIKYHNIKEISKNMNKLDKKQLAVVSNLVASLTAAREIGA